MSANFEELISKVKTCGKKKVSVAVAQDAPILEAVEEARKQGFADAILVGDEEKIRASQAAHRAGRTAPPESIWLTTRSSTSLTTGRLL